MDPITTPIEHMSREEITALVESTMKRKSVIDNNRKSAFGRSGGLMKGLLQGTQQADKDLKVSFDYLMAAAEGDTSYLRKAQEGYRQSVIDAYNSEEISRTEFKVLSPAIEGTNSAGGYNVPLPFAAELSRNLGNYGYARRFFRIMPMDRQKLAIAGLLTKPSVATTAENNAITASKPALDQLTITAKKVAAIYAASNEYLADANIDVLSVIIEIFGEQFGIAEDTGAFQNANTDWPGLLWYGAGTITSGIAANGARAISRSNSSTGGKTGYPQIGDTIGATDTWTDLIYLLQGQPSALFQGGCFFIDQNVLVAALSLRTSTGQFVGNFISNLEIQTGLDGDPIMYYMGYRIVPLPSGIMLTYDASAHVSTPYTAFCNPQRSWCVMGQRGGFEVDMSISATTDTINAFTNDLKLFRMKERIGFGVGRPETVSILRTDAS